jgi:hypothetical protein
MRAAAHPVSGARRAEYAFSQGAGSSRVKTAAVASRGKLSLAILAPIVATPMAQCLQLSQDFIMQVM